MVINALSKNGFVTIDFICAMMEKCAYLFFFVADLLGKGAKTEQSMVSLPQVAFGGCAIFFDYYYDRDWVDVFFHCRYININTKYLLQVCLAIA